MQTLQTLPIVSFYVAAHQDDWQLFRGNWAWNDVKCGAKVVFIYVTAGDGGQGEKQWRAREAAAMASVVAITGQPAAPPAQENFNGRPITCYVSALTRSYFLRLPDGGFDEPGKGYERTGYQSLTLLRIDGKRMVAVDCSASYESWQDLVETVSAILTHETETSSSMTPGINTSRKDRLANPGDHFDHYEVGEIIEAFAPGRENVVGWAGYTNRPKQVEHPELEKKRALMRAYRTVMEDQLEDFDVAAVESHDEGFMGFEGE